MSYQTDEQGRLRKNAKQVLRLKEKAPPLERQSTVTREARRPSRAKITFFGFRIQPPLPRWLAPNSVCQWSTRQPLKRFAPVHVSLSKVPTTTGELFNLAEEWRLNLQP